MASLRNDPPRRLPGGKLKMYVKGHRVTWGQALTKGKSLYEKIRIELEANHPGQYVYIDVHSGDHEVASDRKTAERRMFERHPDAVLWGRTVGHEGNGRAANCDD